MTNFALWLLGALAAFFLTAGAFLLLANLGAGPGRSGPIPQDPRAESPEAGPALSVRFAQGTLEELETSTGQTVVLYVENLGEEEIPAVDVGLAVASESTAGTPERDYGISVANLAPGETRTVEMEVDLSAPIAAESGELATSGGREILEARATAPGDPSAIQTAVLP